MEFCDGDHPSWNFQTSVYWKLLMHKLSTVYILIKIKEDVHSQWSTDIKSRNKNNWECHRKKEEIGMKLSWWVKQFFFFCKIPAFSISRVEPNHFFKANAKKGNVVFTAMPRIIAIILWNSTNHLQDWLIKAGRKGKGI